MTISRREFLRRAECVAAGGILLGHTGWAAAKTVIEPSLVSVDDGPTLFLDSYAIETMAGLKRVMTSPQRLPEPVLDSKTFGVWQPYMTVLRNDAADGYRMWYNRGDAVGIADSSDGIKWRDPREVWKISRSFGASVVDDGPNAADQRRRYKLANWQATRKLENKPNDDGGMWVGFSADGVHWESYKKNPVIAEWPRGFGKLGADRVQDIVDAYYDPATKRYWAALKTPAMPEDGLRTAPRAGTNIRRLVSMSSSDDFVHWEKPWRILVPEDESEGMLEFYGMGGIHRRGSLYIGFVRALHDDLPCDPGGPADGIGYTTLATSRDGKTWTRYREPFLDRNPQPGSWDHAMTWIGQALPQGDETLLYYGGYARGHKVEPMTERQIGLARMKRDRYVALTADASGGRIVTRPFRLPKGKLTVNAAAAKGEVTVRLLGVDQNPIAELGDGAARQIREDSLAATVEWAKPIESLRGKPVRLEFAVKDAALFGFEFVG